ncbi:MAG: TSUP family transporter [Thermodesulfobacteriota bacterium]
MVPVQFWVLQSIGVDPTIAIRIAFGTNLLVVLPTAFSGAMTHHRKGAVIWKAGVAFGIAGAVGAFIASHLPGKTLTVAFGIAVILGACSVPLAIVGAKTAHLLPAKQLKYIFIAVMFYMGLKMTGVFAWLHLPI